MWAGKYVDDSSAHIVFKESIMNIVDYELIENLSLLFQSSVILYGAVIGQKRYLIFWRK